MDAETKGLVERAARRWCREKREFSLVDAEYFRQNWQSLPGLNQYVIDEAAATITRLTAERDEARARAERAEGLLYQARHAGLVYWEPQTERGAVAKAQMLARIDTHLTQEASDGQS